LEPLAKPGSAPHRAGCHSHAAPFSLEDCRQTDGGMTGSRAIVSGRRRFGYLVATTPANTM